MPIWRRCAVRRSYSGSRPSRQPRTWTATMLISSAPRDLTIKKIWTPWWWPRMGARLWPWRWGVRPLTRLNSMRYVPGSLATKTATRFIACHRQRLAGALRSHCRQRAHGYFRRRRSRLGTRSIATAARPGDARAAFACGRCAAVRRRKDAGGCQRASDRTAPCAGFHHVAPVAALGEVSRRAPTAARSISPPKANATLPARRRALRRGSSFFGVCWAARWPIRRREVECPPRSRRPSINCSAPPALLQMPRGCACC